MRAFKIVWLPVFISVVLFVVLESCKTRSRSAETGMQNDADSLFVMLNQEPCFGTCPTFVVNVYKSGYAVYKGKKGVERVGTYEARFTRDQLKLFDQAAIEYRVDTLQSEYVNPYIADFPASYSSIVIKGKRHSFHISTDTPPQSLADFQETIKRLIEMPKWKKISDTTE